MPRHDYARIIRFLQPTARCKLVSGQRHIGNYPSSTQRKGQMSNHR